MFVLYGGVRILVIRDLCSVVAEERQFTVQVPLSTSPSSSWSLEVTLENITAFSALAVLPTALFIYSEILIS